MAERPAMNKLKKTYPRPLAELIAPALGDVFVKQGFSSNELVTRWPDIVGEEIAAHAEPLKLQWQRGNGVDEAEPATLVLRVEGPAAIEIQHLTPVILERVNRFLGWRAVGRIALRQAPLGRSMQRKRPDPIDPAVADRIAAALPDIADEGLRGALGRLGAAVKRT
jgi:hypothetical protein